MSAPQAPSVAGRGGRTGLARIKDLLRDGAHAALSPITGLVVRAGLKPDHVTWIGLGFGVLSGLAFFEGSWRLAAVLLALGGVCDLLDGELARRSGVRSRFGALLDSTLDRLSESAALLGLAGFYVSNLHVLATDPARGAVRFLQIGLDPIAWAIMACVAVLALVGSFMVSYTRARAEGLGLECRVGWFERPERLVLLILAGLIKGFRVMSVVLILLTIFSFATAVQRLMHVYRNTRGAGLDS